MGQQFEDILDQAMAELRRGKTQAEVLAQFSAQADQLRPLLEVAAIGFAIPRNTVPTPLRRRAYAEKAYKSWWVRSAGVLKFGILPLTLALLLVGGETFVEATIHSLPTDSLYAVKRAVEQAQLKLARTPDQQAALQMQLAQKRLDEVQQAAQAGPEQEAAALTALKDQAENSFAAVSQVAAAQAINNDPKLLNNLLAINKQQQQVLSAIQPQAQTKDVADAALDVAQENGKKLETLLATVQEQTLADLPSKLVASGDATVSADKTTIAISDKTFAITADTVITSASGTPLQAAQLPAAVKANIEGTQTGDKLEAKTISLISSPPAPAKPEPAPPAPAPTTAPPADAPAPATQPTTSDNDSTTQNQVTVHVIAESPNPQYNP